MVAPDLRNYQTELIERYKREVSRGRRRLIGVAPTGSGKTVVAAAIAGQAVSRSQRVLFPLHRRELVRQSAQKLYDVELERGEVDRQLLAQRQIGLRLDLSLRLSGDAREHCVVIVREYDRFHWSNAMARARGADVFGFLAAP
jgi:type I site-specific restriction endonuclease